MEIHQNTPTSSDLLFNFELTANVVVSIPPALHLARTGASLVFTWPADPGVFNIFTATNLTSPVTWTRLTNPPLFTNGQWTLNLPFATNLTRFYRLQSP